MEINESLEVVPGQGPLLGMRGPYWQSVAVIEAVLKDPRLYVGNHSIQSIQISGNPYEKSTVVITLDDDQMITANVQPRWPNQWMDCCKFEIDYSGVIMDEAITPHSEIDRLISQLEREVKGYQITRILLEKDEWNVFTLYNR